MKNKALYLDRDGTLIQERGHISSPRQVRFITGADKALRIFRKHGFSIVVISNQSGVARGILTENQVKKVNQHIRAALEKKGVEVEEIYYCPHHPDFGSSKYRRNCRCRKPAPGMVRKAQKRFNLFGAISYVIGDKLTDIELAGRIKGKGILVLSGYGKEELSKPENHTHRPDFVAKNLVEAAKWVASDLSRTSARSKNI